MILSETRDDTVVRVNFKSKTNPPFSKIHKLLCYGNVLFKTDIQKKNELKVACYDGNEITIVVATDTIYENQEQVVTSFNWK